MMQATITVEGWQALAGAIVIVLTVIFKFVMDLRKDSRERDASSERLQVLRDIAQSNANIVNGQIVQNGKLAQVVMVNNEHHMELIRAINASCKARPIYPPVNQEQKQT